MGDGNNTVFGASFRAGIRALKQFGPCCANAAVGYAGEYWRATDARFNLDIGKDVLADFFFNGPFAQIELKF
jgi:hypothetical protein